MVGRKDRAMLRGMDGTPAWNATLAGIGPQQYLLKTIERGGNRWLVIAGGDDVGTLYGAYRVAEQIGVRFYLHGDVIPDERMRAELPNLDEPGKPLFALRGIQPFNNFPFGPDWWTTEDYKATISQLAKMRMNFIGFHCYPESGIEYYIEATTGDGQRLVFPPTAPQISQTVTCLSPSVRSKR